jgi:hypothetical protein
VTPCRNLLTVLACPGISVETLLPVIPLRGRVLGAKASGSVDDALGFAPGPEGRFSQWATLASNNSHERVSAGFAERISSVKESMRMGIRGGYRINL